MSGSITEIDSLSKSLSRAVFRFRNGNNEFLTAARKADLAKLKGEFFERVSLVDRIRKESLTTTFPELGALIG